MAKTFAVIGDPIDHSLSPNIHSAAFRELGMDCSYIAYRIPAGELESGIGGLLKIGADGFNVTIPHKVDILEHLDRLDESCSLIGAANTVAVSGGSLKGYNTDMDGFLEPLKSRSLGLRGSNVLLLGAGGAARAIVAALAKEGASRVDIANRTEGRSKELATFAGRIGLDAHTTGFGGIESVSKYDLVVNATSLGLAGEPCPIPLAGAGAGTTVYDIVYKPINTDMVKRAKEAGARVVFGYEMLLGQAARAFEVWHGVPAPRAAMKRALLGGA